MAKSIYVGQSSAGSDDGTSVGNRHAITWANTSGNWGVGSGKVNNGDTIILSGTFTTALVLQGSGASGNRITVLFDAGANFTTGCWPSTGAIELNGQSHITIDGGTNGLITNTSNGTGLATQTGSKGIVGVADNITIQNVTISRMYYKTIGVIDETREGYPINVLGGGNILIQNNTVSDGDGGIVYSANNATQSNVRIVNNTLFNCNHTMVIGVGNSNCALSDIRIYGNSMDHWDVWDAPGDTGIHLDGIIVLNNTNDVSSNITDFHIYNNFFGGYIGTRTTAGIFIDVANPGQQMFDLYIHDNLFLVNGSTYSWGNGFIAAAGANVWVFNNTCYSTTGNGGGIFAYGSDINIFNNILLTTTGIGMGGDTTDTGIDPSTGGSNTLAILTSYFGDVYSDYNVFSPSVGAFGLALTQIPGTSTSWVINAGFNSLHNWQTYYDNEWGWSTPTWNSLHADPHSVSGVPVFNSGTYVPAPTDTVAKGNGTNLTSMCVTAGISPVDYNGVSRPSSGPWTIGAFESVATSTFNITLSGILHLTTIHIG